MIVVVELWGMALASLVVLDRRAIDEEDVHPAVIVVIECGGASALGFDDGEFLAASAKKMEVDAGGVRDINEQGVGVDGGLLR